jgi:hypothetical protein
MALTCRWKSRPQHQFLTHAPQNLLLFTVPGAIFHISFRRRMICARGSRVALRNFHGGYPSVATPDTADLNPGPADIMSDVWPQKTLTFHLGYACQVRLIGDE